jgi:hypothetical protein
MLELDHHQSFTYIEEICYEAHSTGIIAEREMFSMKNEVSAGDGASMVDDIWWNAEKKIESI